MLVLRWSVRKYLHIYESCITIKEKDLLNYEFKKIYWGTSWW